MSESDESDNDDQENSEEVEEQVSLQAGFEMFNDGLVCLQCWMAS